MVAAPPHETMVSHCGTMPSLFTSHIFYTRTIVTTLPRIPWYTLHPLPPATDDAINATSIGIHLFTAQPSVGRRLGGLLGRLGIVVLATY